jgi:hypothetical protein
MGLANLPAEQNDQCTMVPGKKTLRDLNANITQMSDLISGYR